MGSRTGKTFKGVTCKAAQEVWRRYLALPPDPDAGNSNHRELDDGWVCYAPTAASAATYDEGGICERKAQNQKFVLHFRRG